MTDIHTRNHPDQKNIPLIMKRLLRFFFTAATILCWSTPASAAAINLSCDEKGGTELEKSTRSGETEKAVAELWSIPTMIDTASGRATMWGQNREMSVEPEKLILREYLDEKTAAGRSTKISTLEINRKKLTFNYVWYYQVLYTNPSLGLTRSTSTTRKTSGVCAKVQNIKGNKI